MLARPVNTVDDTQPIDTRREILLLLGTFPQTSWKTLGLVSEKGYLGGVLNKTGLSAARTTRISLWVLPFNREDSLS